ncbi:hypothetical protein NE865_06887 [Phthorimaea operculella]|nr:hypothetical protein NE865_06887 [Phthorimaea operculella]
MESQIMVEPLPLLGVCNLCLQEGAVHSMLLGIKNDETTETYMEMLLKCFSIDISILDLGDTKNVICDLCASKLLESITFKRQVEMALQTLEAAVKYKKPEVKTETIEDYTDTFDPGFDDEEDNMVLKDIAIKKEPPSEDIKPKKIRKKIVKKEIKLVVKTKHLQEAENMLTAGLFPFKIKKDNTFSCAICPEKSTNLDDIKNHVNEHIFDRVTKRENHVSKEHKSGVRYACKRCNISLPSFYARQKHLAEVHNEELKRYKCKACSQSYITPGHLSSHVRRDHLNERNHKCDKCDLAFYTRNALKMHMIKHDGERIHTCSVCQKSYQRKKTLREHMRIHTNDKRFICPVCGRAFTQKCTLKGHLKVHERKVEIDDRVMPPLHSI